MIGTTELFVILAIVFVLFGATAIPKFAKSLGQAKKVFKEAAEEDSAEAEKKETVEKTEKKAE